MNNSITKPGAILAEELLKQSEQDAAITPMDALLGATLSVIDDELIRHQLHSQSAEELMHFMEGKYQIDAYALTAEDQKPIEEVFDFLLRPWAPEPSRALGGNS